MLNWLVNEHGIGPHIPVFDKSQHADGTFSLDELAYDPKRDCYIRPAGNELRQRQKIYRVPRPLFDRNGMMRYRASKLDCQNCSLKPQCCPNAPFPATHQPPAGAHDRGHDGARLQREDAQRLCAKRPGICGLYWPVARHDDSRRPAIRALRGLAQSAARELGPKGIHVAHFVIDAECAARYVRIQLTVQTSPSIPTRSRRPISRSCASRRAPGPWRSSCRPPDPTPRVCNICRRGLLDSPLEGGVSCELVSEVKFASRAPMGRFHGDWERFLVP